LQIRRAEIESRAGEKNHKPPPLSKDVGKEYPEEKTQGGERGWSILKGLTVALAGVREVWWVQIRIVEYPLEKKCQRGNPGKGEENSIGSRDEGTWKKGGGGGGPS